MYAVVKTGGKQYRVEKEDVVLVERLSANDGDQILLDNVLMIGEGEKITVGSPLVNDAAVMAQVIRQTRGPKITMIYKRRRKNSRRKQGHKQNLTLLKIIDIAETGGSKLSPKKAPEIKAKVATKPAEIKAKAAAKPAETKAKAVAKPAETKAKAATKPVQTKAKAAAKPAETKAKAAAKPKKTTTKE